MSKAEKVPKKDRVFWWLSIIAAVCYFACIVPVVPWRFAKVDTNMGNRFVMDRQYRLFSATDQFGKGIGWMTLKTKFKRKTDEFGRPSPLTALIGTASAMLGVGGAAMGCSTWQQCKDHVRSRYMGYNTVAITGIASAVMILIGLMCTIGALVLMGFEEGASKKKKKKKDDEDCCTPKGRTMTCCVVGWFLAMSGVNAFVFVLDMTLKNFKETAYYPYAMSYPGAFIGWAGCFCQFISVIIAMWRAEVFGKKKEEEKDDMMGGYPPPGGYGGPNPYAPGPGPPGQYGPGYGGPPQ